MRREAARRTDEVVRGRAPFVRAAEHWNTFKDADDYTFAQLVEAHSLYGYAIATPTAFALFRRVDSTWTNYDLCNPDTAGPGGDCWHVYLAAGRLADILALMPYELPFVSFHRNRGERKRLIASRVLLARVHSRA